MSMKDKAKDASFKNKKEPANSCTRKKSRKSELSQLRIRRSICLFVRARCSNLIMSAATQFSISGRWLHVCSNVRPSPQGKECAVSMVTPQVNRRGGGIVDKSLVLWSHYCPVLETAIRRRHHHDETLNMAQFSSIVRVLGELEGLEQSLKSQCIKWSAESTQGTTETQS